MTIIETKPLLRDLINRYSDKISSEFDSIFLSPNIPSKKLNGALNSYGQQINEDEVLVLFDDTVFGGAKEGFLITETIIASKALGATPKIFFFKDISTIDIKKNDIYLNGNKSINLAMANEKKLRSLVEALGLFIGKIPAENNNSINAKVTDNFISDESTNLKPQNFAAIRKVLDFYDIVVQNIKNDLSINDSDNVPSLSKAALILLCNQIIIIKNYSSFIFKDDSDYVETAFKSEMIMSFLYAYSSCRIARSFDENEKTDELFQEVLKVLAIFFDNFYMNYENVRSRYNLDPQFKFSKIIEFIKAYYNAESREKTLCDTLETLGIEQRVANQLRVESKKAYRRWLNIFRNDDYLEGKICLSAMTYNHRHGEAEIGKYDPIELDSIRRFIGLY